MTGQRVTLVTGGSRGIGAAVCRHLARDGHEVVVGYRFKLDAAQQVVDDIVALGGRAIPVAVDVADEASVIEFFHAAEALGPVTGLVNSAGIGGRTGDLADTQIETIRRVVEVNFIGSLTCSKHAIRAMRGRGGAIVNISSAAATLGSPGLYVHYAATKAAIDAYTVGLAKEVAVEGIRVNAVAPGTIWTEFHEDPERPAKVAPTIPMGRAGRPDEVSGAVAWLLSDEASYTTGTIIRVAGGL